MNVGIAVSVREQIFDCELCVVEIRVKIGAVDYHPLSFLPQPSEVRKGGRFSRPPEGIGALATDLRQGQYNSR